MMTDFQVARKIFGMAVFSVILCFFVQLSFFALIQSFSTEVVRYDIYDATKVDENNPKGAYVTTYEKDELPENLDRNVLKPYPVLSEMPASARVVETVLSTVFSLGIFVCTTGSVLADAAAKDRNNSDFNGAPYNKTRGFKIGLLAAIPSAVFYVATVVLRFFPSNKIIDWYFWFYRFVALGPVKPLNDRMTWAQLETGEFGAQTDLSLVLWWWVISTVLYIALFVLFCYAVYRICYNEDSWLAKLLYKSKDPKNVRRLGGR